MRWNRSGLGGIAGGVVFATAMMGCAAPAERSTSSEAEVASGTTPFDVVTYDFELVPEAAHILSDDCTVEVDLWTVDETPVPAGKHHVTRAGDRVQGRFSARRYERFRQIRYTSYCKTDGENQPGYYGAAQITGKLDPEMGSERIGVSSVHERPDADMQLRVAVAGVQAPTDLEDANCAGGATGTLYVRLRTTLYKKHGFLQGPHGDDFTQTIMLDGDAKLTHSPEAEKETNLFFTYCPSAGAVDSVHVDLTLLEDDVLANDEYTPASVDVPVGSTSRTGHSATSTAASASFPSWVTVLR